MLRSHGRYPYVPITRQTPGRWPNGARLAVYFALGVEEYVFGEGLTENLLAGASHPDLANTSWRDYGNRVGAFRILDHFQRKDVPLAVLLNTAVYDHAPDLPRALTAAGCEIIAHGLTNSDTLNGMTEPEEAAYLARVRDAILAREGEAPRGWSSPWLAHTPLTLDLLRETGYGYVLDFGLDDRPVWLTTRSGPLLHIPYALELNDSSTAIGRLATGRDFATMIVDQFDEMLASADQPLVMSVVLHSFISGQPFRLRAFSEALAHIVARREDVWLTTPRRIHDHLVAHPEHGV
jgi:peptidoglycan/xylan/chitin deacetylase (PgdA/CDA1 family)